MIHMEYEQRSFRQYNGNQKIPSQTLETLCMNQRIGQTYHTKTFEWSPQKELDLKQNKRVIYLETHHKAEYIMYSNKKLTVNNVKINKKIDRQSLGHTTKLLIFNRWLNMINPTTLTCCFKFFHLMPLTVDFNEESISLDAARMAIIRSQQRY